MRLKFYNADNRVEFTVFCHSVELTPRKIYTTEEGVSTQRAEILDDSFKVGAVLFDFATVEDQREDAATEAAAAEAKPKRKYKKNRKSRKPAVAEPAAESPAVLNQEPATTQGAE